MSSFSSSNIHCWTGNTCWAVYLACKEGESCQVLLAGSKVVEATLSQVWRAISQIFHCRFFHPQMPFHIESDHAILCTGSRRDLQDRFLIQATQWIVWIHWVLAFAPTCPCSKPSPVSDTQQEQWQEYEMERRLARCQPLLHSKSFSWGVNPRPLAIQPAI